MEAEMQWVTREHGLPDQEQLALELPVYAALYAWCRREVGAA
jgi:hypothetical protein